MRYLIPRVGLAAVVLPAMALAQTQKAQQPDTTGAILMEFSEAASAKNVSEPGYGRGAAMVDLDQDGMLDLVVAMAGMENALLRQKADGTFEKMNTAWGFPNDTTRSWGVLAADFDNDGDRDLYFPTGGFSGAQPNLFLRNDLNTSGNFANITMTAGDAHLDQFSSFGGTVLDYDLDGDLDIFVSNNGVAIGGTTTNRLLRNDGNLTFTDVSQAAGVDVIGDYRHCSSGDIDNDGDVDIYVGNYVGANALFRNEGNGTFTEIAATAGVQDPNSNFGGVLIDFNNDGWLDLYGARYQFNGNYPSGLYLNNQDGTFRDVRMGARIRRQKDMGHNCADLNADGFPDIFIGTGHPNQKINDVVLLVRPTPGDRLMTASVAQDSGFLTLGKTRTHGVAFGDIDRDGDLDVYTNNGGPDWVPNSWQENGLFLADGNANNWLQVEPIGVVSNKSAVGTRMMAVTGDDREIHRFSTVGRGFCNTDSPIIHFGLGPANRLKVFRMLWPTGKEQVYLDLPVDEMHKIYECGFTWSGNPAPNATISVDAYGPPNTTVEMFYSMTAGETMDRALGGIYRMGGNIRTLPAVTTGADGKVSTSFVIPNDPGLSGRTMYLQAKVVDPSGDHPTTLTHNAELPVQ